MRLSRQETDTNNRLNYCEKGPDYQLWQLVSGKLSRFPTFAGTVSNHISIKDAF
jgi:hypothetical protein